MFLPSLDPTLLATTFVIYICMYVYICERIHVHKHTPARLHTSIAGMIQQKRKEKKREWKTKKEREREGEREVEGGGRRVGENKRQDEPRARKSSWIRVGAAGAAGCCLSAGGSELEKNLISGERIQTGGRR